MGTRVRTQTGPNVGCTSGPRVIATWNFDQLGRVTSRRDNDGSTEACGYGDDLNLTAVTTRTGGSIAMSYDAAGHMTLRIASAEQDTLKYDPEGRPFSVNNSHSRILRSYSRRGQLIWEQEGIRSWGLVNGAYQWFNVSREHRYDRNGRLRATFMTPATGSSGCIVIPDDPTCDGSVTLVYGDSIRYRYNSRGLVDSIVNTMWRDTSTSAINRGWAFQYDSRGRLFELDVPTGTGSAPVTYTYDDADRLLTYTVSPALGSGRNQSATYSIDGVLTQVADGGVQNNYSYDGLGQLTSESGQTVASYTYDPAGNRLTGAGWTYTYNSSTGRLSWRTGSNGTMTTTYDAAGNLFWEQTNGAQCQIGGYTRQLSYSSDNRTTTSLRHVYSSQAGRCTGESRSYWYDGLGRLVLVRSDSSYASDWGVTRFWWLGHEVAVRHRNPIAYLDTWQPSLVRSGSGILAAVGEWYFPGPGTDQALGSFNFQNPGQFGFYGTGHKHLYVRDWRGSVLKVLDATGTLSPQPHGDLSYSYTAFGDADGAVAQAGPGYNGAPSIDGFQYLRNRWYDPGTGRFTQEDPIGFAGGINLYAYAGNDPVQYSDPYGLECPNWFKVVCLAYDFLSASGVRDRAGILNSPPVTFPGAPATVRESSSRTIAEGLKDAAQALERRAPSMPGVARVLGRMVESPVVQQITRGGGKFLPVLGALMTAHAVLAPPARAEEKACQIEHCAPGAAVKQ